MPDETRHYPDRLEIRPLTKPPLATVRVPGSKSITNRALVLAALSGRGCELHGALRCEDTEVMVNALRALGFAIEVDWPACRIHIGPNESGRVVPAPSADLFVANSGTSMRFLTALAGAGQGRYRLDGVPRMRERPLDDLLTAIRELGVSARSEKDNGCPPVAIETDGFSSGTVRVKGNVSSQFISGLLMAATRARGPVTIRCDGAFVSWPYVLMTVEQMKQFGAAVEPISDNGFLVPGNQEFGTSNYHIEPDASAASYFWGAAAVMAGQVTVAGISKSSLQGDVRFIDALEKMGCELQHGAEGISIRGRTLHGIDIDMNDVSDTVMTLAVVACFAEGPTSIRNVAHIRHKETDRLNALANELRRVGAEVEEFADGLTITPRPLHGARIETYNDHRMAMSMALIGLRVPGIVIENPACVAKTYPGFFDDLEKLR